MNIKHKATLEKYFLILRNELNYSINTVNNYSSHLKEYLEYFDKSPMNLTYLDYKDFAMSYKFTGSKQNQFISSVKLFYRHMLKYKIKDEIFIRPRKEKYLPEILSQDEIKLMINSISNIKHQCIIATIYYFGLRVSECINLKYSDFDKARKSLHIRQSKNNKDRNIPFQIPWIDVANKYFIKYKPKGYLFEGQNGRYSKTSIRNILNKALKSCNINKRITIHCLRHSFCVHLLENGVDSAIIQQIMGHNDIKTTLGYMKMTTKCFEQVVLY